MSTSRYYFLPTIDGTFYATSDLTSRIYNAADNGVIPTNVVTIENHKRLDVIAFESYGDASLWWIIAAASGIGWSMQLTRGTYIRVPTDLNAVYSLMRAD
jgi:hypothetical protein